MTSYDYPTWADILGKSWGMFENWAMSGGSNGFIFNSVVECDARNKFTEYDTVIIMWTTVARRNVYRHSKWIQNIENLLTNPVDKTANCPIGYEIESFVFMKAVEEILEKRKVHYIPCTWVKYDTIDPPGNLYKDTISKIKFIPSKFNEKEYNAIYIEKGLEHWKSQYEIIAGKDWPTLEQFLINDFSVSNDFVKKELEEFTMLVENDSQWRHKKIIEKHPSPLQHLGIARNIMPDIIISSDTVEWIENIEKDLSDGVKFSFNRNQPIRL